MLGFESLGKMFIFKKLLGVNLIAIDLHRHQSTNLRRVVVTGLGAISPLGNNVESSWNQILKGNCAITSLNEDYNGLPCRVAAQVDKESLDIPNRFSKTDLKVISPPAILALLAAEEAVSSAKLIDIDEKVRDRIGVCVGMGMFDLTEIYNCYQSFKKGYHRVSPFFVPRILPSMVCGHISMKFGFRGPNHSVSTACATGAHSIGDAMRFIKFGDADIIIAGSGESCIDPLSIAGFCRLRALSTSFNDQPHLASRPFDKRRDGFVMGEGAAILVLEELNHAKTRNAPILAEILGYGLSGDAHHITSPSENGSGANRAMKQAISNANVSPIDISYINAHATSTPTGDKIESIAIASAFEEHTKNIQVSSTKGAHGHLLGSSGSLEALFVVKACKEGILPPTINLEEIGDDININIVKEASTWNKIRRIALKNAFGFGGTNVCLCIANYET